MNRRRLFLLFMIVGIFLIGGAGSCRSRGETIKIGWIGVLSGENAVAGDMIKRGTDLAVKQINDAGGINGRQLEVIYQDDQLDPKVGVSAFEKLVSVDRVPVVIQAIGSSVMLAEAPLAERRKVVLISPTCTSDEITNAGDYIFRISPRDSDQGEVLARIASQKFNAKKSACLFINNAYGEGLRNNYVQSFQRDGGEVAVTEGFNTGTTDLRTQLVKVKAANVPVTALISHFQEGATALRQARELGLRMQFIGPDGLFVPRIIDLTTNASDGLIVTTFGWNKETPIARQFSTAFQATYNMEPDVFAAYGYDCLRVIANAIQKGGITPDGIKQALYDTKNLDGVTGPTTFDRNGDVQKPFSIYRVENGKFKDISLEIKLTKDGQ